MDTAAEQHLLNGEMEPVGRIADASNGSLFVTIHHEDAPLSAIYKPVVGERPLWDFPRNTLSRREVAAYRLSRLMGLDVVPETVWRDGPAGMGSVQRWAGVLPTDTGILALEPGADVVDLVPSGQVADGWFDVFEGEDHLGQDITLCHADDARLKRLALFDVLANNADRKGGHILAEGGRLLGIDHGLTFNEEPKLRTVLWGWAGQRIPLDLLESVQRVVDGFDAVVDTLGELISDDELLALQERAHDLLVDQRFPQPPRGDWPAIPWPPF